MIVSTKGRYALRVMIDLAEHQSEKYTPLKEIAARQQISEKYLENILKTLVQNGLLQGAARQRRRLPPDPRPQPIPDIGHFAVDRRQSGPGGLSGAGRRLRPAVRVPHLRNVARPGRGDPDLSGQDHPGRPGAPRPGRGRLCDLTPPPHPAKDGGGFFRRPPTKQCGGRLCSRPPQRDPIFRDAKVLLFWCDQQQKEYWFYSSLPPHRMGVLPERAGGLWHPLAPYIISRYGAPGCYK